MIKVSRKTFYRFLTILAMVAIIAILVRIEMRNPDHYGKPTHHGSRTIVPLR